MAFVKFQNVSKTFGSTVAVERLDLAIGQGEFFSLLGPSGCGKTTTLRMLAGFLKPSTGRIHVNNRDITSLPPESRGIGIVFQNYAIFPHMNVFDNIAFGLVERSESKPAIKRKVESALEQVGLSGFGGRFQRELSGGQMQRVALARVLVIEPEILLLDEPLSALDKKMREEMKYWIKDIQKSVGITTIYVTHDQSEALTMSDRIGVMDAGNLLQVGTPTAIYEEPVSRFIAGFIGNSNLLEATVVKTGKSSCEVDLGDGIIVNARRPEAVPVKTGDLVGLLLRPEILRFNPLKPDEEPRMKGRIVNKVYQGALRHYSVKSGAHDVSVEISNRPDLQQIALGEVVELYWSENSGTVVPWT